MLGRAAARLRLNPDQYSFSVHLNKSD
jgi:hypothetical protein